MASLAFDTLTTTVSGNLTSTFTGGVAPYYYSLDGGAKVSIPNIFGSYFVSQNGLTYGLHSLTVEDGNGEQISQNFTVSYINSTAACMFTGVGNEQGIIDISFDVSLVDDILLTGPNGYSRNTATADAVYGTNERELVFVFVHNGTYHVDAFGFNGAVVYSNDLVLDCGNSDLLRIDSITENQATGATNADGEAVINLTDGVGSGPAFLIQTHLGDFVWRTAIALGSSKYVIAYGNMLPGKYTVFVRDTAGQTTQQDFTITYKSGGGPVIPTPPPVAKARFKIPLLNSLRYVVGNGTSLPNFDNRVYCSEDWPGIFRVPYYQKVCREDALVTQFQSNYQAHKAELVNYETGAVVSVLTVKKAKQNIGLEILYSAWLTTHGADVTKSRLYFNAGNLPLAFVAGDTVKVQNATPSSVDGSKTVERVAFDDSDSIPYLVLNYAYPLATARISVNVSTPYDALPYDIYEFHVDWDGIGNGVYIIRLTATHPDYSDAEAVTEPFALLPSHPNTHLISWRNFDDAHNLTFTTGFVCNLRVESDLFERTPGGSRKVLDLPNGRLLKLSSTSIRRAEFVTKSLPPWLHEKIAFLFGLDHIEINLVEYQTREEYNVDGSKTLALRNGSITVEEVGSSDQNGLDLGDVLAPGNTYISTGNKYIIA